MELKIFNQKEMQSQPELINFMLDTIINNLTYLYGPYMDTEENRKIWAENNIYNEKENTKFLIAFDEIPLGFIIYNINEDHILIFKDIEIKKYEEKYPLLLFSLLKALAKEEGDNFDAIQGYINKNNELSMRNFMRFASYKIEKQKGFYIVIDRETTSKLKEKFIKKN